MSMSACVAKLPSISVLGLRRDPIPKFPSLSFVHRALSEVRGKACPCKGKAHSLRVSHLLIFALRSRANPSRGCLPFLYIFIPFPVPVLFDVFMTYEQSRSGGASGIGKHLAETLHSQGVTLIIADINEVTGVSLVEALNKSRGQYVREKTP